MLGRLEGESEQISPIALHGLSTLLSHRRPSQSRFLSVLLLARCVRELRISRCLKITAKSLIQHCERSELRLHFEWTKVNQKCRNGPLRKVSENLKIAIKQCYQRVTFNKAKIGEKCQNCKCDNSVDKSS